MEKIAKEKRMQDSVCHFVPPAAAYARVETLRFVYETEIFRLRQPMRQSGYCLVLVEGGSATLVRGRVRHPVGRGSVFLLFPGQAYSLLDHRDLTYTYIVFDGEGAEAMLAPLALGPTSPPYEGQAPLCAYALERCREAIPQTIALISESVLLYVLARLYEETLPTAPERGSRNLYGAVLDCVERRFTDPDLSLAELGRLYSYSEKYLSALFKKNTGVGFAAYLTELRISRARELLAAGEGSVADVARDSGFRDPLYFSRVFRSSTGMSPSEYRKRAAHDPVLAFTKRFAAGGGGARAHKEETV